MAQMEYVKKNFILVASFERTLLVVTHTFIVILYAHSGFPILSSSEHMLCVAMNIPIDPYSHLYGNFMFVHSMCMISGLLLSTVCESILILLDDWMFISIQ